jgi:hypothetical protein
MSLPKDQHLRQRKAKRLPLWPAQLVERWLPPGVRKNRPSSPVPVAIRDDPRQLSFDDWAESPSSRWRT